MKKFIACIAAALLLVTFAPVQSKAATEKNPVSISATEKESAEIKALIDRVNEINAMDRSKMTSFEKREFRKELRSIKKDVNHRSHSHGGGVVYISGGLLVLIIVLIIVF